MEEAKPDYESLKEQKLLLKDKICFGRWGGRELLCNEHFLPGTGGKPLFRECLERGIY